MRPPSATDYQPRKRLRIIYTRKHAPYNAGEERVVEDTVARKLCIMGVAIPSPSKGRDDEFGGWSLTADQSRAKEHLLADRKSQAGDFAGDLEDEEAARQDEIRRVEAESKPEATTGKGKPAGGFSRGKRESGNEAEART